MLPLSKLLSVTTIRGSNTHQGKQQPLKLSEPEREVADLLSSPAPILRVENTVSAEELGRGEGRQDNSSSICTVFPEDPCSSRTALTSTHVASEVSLLPSFSEKEEMIADIGEFSISRIVNEHVGGPELEEDGEMDEEGGGFLIDRDGKLSPLGTVVSPNSSIASSGKKKVRVKSSQVSWMEMYLNNVIPMHA